jgi:membrane-associated protease RseP (regulator of RpoE activity)
VSETTQDLSPFFAPSPAPPLPLFARPRRSRWREYGRPALLFLVTAACIWVHGAIISDDLVLWRVASWQRGLILVASICSIMLAHEMGHYLACRYYRVDASLPHFLPAPPIFAGLHAAPWLISLFGTFGAFIRIRGPIPHRRALFDIGVAGPLAGFAIVLIVLAVGIATATQVPVAPLGGGEGGLAFNDPPLFRLTDTLAGVLLPAPASGMVWAMNPAVGLAAWFGVFLTALNLMPVGQLDGGHAVYALLPRYAHRVSRVGMWLSLVLLYFSPTWLVWAVLMRLVGRPHPPTLDDSAPIGRARTVVGLVTLAVFLLCFMPIPIQVTWGELYDATRAMLSRGSLT